MKKIVFFILISAFGGGIYNFMINKRINNSCFVFIIKLLNFDKILKKKLFIEKYHFLYLILKMI